MYPPTGGPLLHAGTPVGTGEGPNVGGGATSHPRDGVSGNTCEAADAESIVCACHTKSTW